MESFTQAYSSWNNNYSSPLHTKERIQCFSKILVYLSGKFYPLCAPHKQNLNEIELCASRNFYSCFRKLTRAGQGHGGHTVSSAKATVSSVATVATVATVANFTTFYYA